MGYHLQAEMLCPRRYLFPLHFYLIEERILRTNYNNNTHLMAMFQGSSGQLVSECHHSGFYFIEIRMLEMMVTTKAIRSAKVKSNNHHPQTNMQIFTGRMPFLMLNQQWQSYEGNEHILKRHFLIRHLIILSLCLSVWLTLAGLHIYRHLQFSHHVPHQNKFYPHSQWTYSLSLSTLSPAHRPHWFFSQQRLYGHNPLTWVDWPSALPESESVVLMPTLKS